MTLSFTILGCGFSGGVPRPGPGWGKCDPAEPKNRRRRCSLLVERRSDAGVTRVLVDTSPDLREQLLGADVSWLDGVLFTHDHADHTHGIDDLRGLFIQNRRRLDVWMDEPTSRVVTNRFQYCFETPPGSNYPPILNEHRIVPGEAITIRGEGGAVTALPFLVHHGDIMALGFRFGDVAYSPDVVDIPTESLPHLTGLEVWIVDALWYRQHPSHFSVSDALAWIERLNARRAVLTNLHTDLDYNELRERVPAHVDVAFDGYRLDAKET